MGGEYKRGKTKGKEAFLFMDADQTNVLEHCNIFGCFCDCDDNWEGYRIMEVEELGYEYWWEN